jgi:CheY-like chemotaxis protein
MMEPPNVDVVIVDDVPGAAADYAALVRAATGFRVAAFEDPPEALDVVRAHQVRVVVLDQRLDGKTPSTGTDLYRQMREIDPSIRAIMLTGLADSAEVGAAVSLGFRDYVEKNHVQALAQKVLSQYAAYQSDIASAALASQQPVVLTKRRGLMRGTRATFRLVDIQVLQEDYVDEKEWSCFLTLHAGQRLTVQRSRQVQASLTLEAEAANKLTAEIGLTAKKITDLKARLADELTTRIKITNVQSDTVGESFKVTYELPAEPADVTSTHVALRRLWQAPVYRRLRASLASSCDCCGLRNVLVLDVRVPADKRALRQEDRLTDGITKMHDLGTE